MRRDALFKSMSVIPPRPRIFSCYTSEAKERDFWYSDENVGFFQHEDDKNRRLVCVERNQLRILGAPGLERAMGLDTKAIHSTYMLGEPIPPLANAIEYYANVLTCRDVKNVVHLYVSGEDEGLVTHVFGGDTRVPKWLFCFELSYRFGQLVLVTSYLPEPFTLYNVQYAYKDRSKLVDGILTWLAEWQTPRRCISLLVDFMGPAIDVVGLRSVGEDSLTYEQHISVEDTSWKGPRSLFELFFTCSSLKTRNAIRYLRAQLPKLGIRIREVREESALDRMSPNLVGMVRSLKNWKVPSLDKWLCYAELRYPYHVEQLTSSVLALFPLEMPAYVLLWILDLTSAWFRSFAEQRKIDHIQRVLKSCRTVIDKRSSSSKNTKK
jgi:hypothetical protein